MLQPDDPVYILLATYNGERFLPAQIDSLLAQDDPDWLLLVRDDGSTDGSLQILSQAARSDRRVRILRSGTERLGSTGSFFELMQQAMSEGARYFALCDQDDVWLPQKLSLMRLAMHDLEGAADRDAALLCWSDLSWIDADGRTLAHSHFRRAGAAVALSGPGPWLLAMNVVPGCAMLGNRALLETALPQPPGIDHHDWWLALVAAAAGHVRVLDMPLAAYRQHLGNAVGAASPLAKLIQALRSPAALPARGRTTYWQAVANARHLYRRLGRDRLPPAWRQAVEHAVEELGAASRLRRLGAVVRGPVRRIGWWRNLLMLVSAFGAEKRPETDSSDFA